MIIISLNTAIFEKTNRQLQAFLTQTPADILLMQEVTRKNDPGTNDDYITKPVIDDAARDLTNSFYAPTWITRNFQKKGFHDHDDFSVDYGGFLEFGNYIRTRYPISFGKNVFLENSFSYITDWSSWPETEYRAVQITDIVLPDGSKLRLMNYHGIWTKDKKGDNRTLNASRRIIELAGDVPYPVILCGDFNLHQDSPSIAILNGYFRNICTEYNISSTRPTEVTWGKDGVNNVIDYIFTHGPININTFNLIDTKSSDHLALHLDFDLP